MIGTRITKIDLEIAEIIQVKVATFNNNTLDSEEPHDGRWELRVSLLATGPAYPPRNESMQAKQFRMALMHQKCELARQSKVLACGLILTDSE